MEPVGVDPRWGVFGPFHDYLLKSFPLVYDFPRVRVLFLTGLQSFHLVPDQSQHLGFGLRLARVRPKPQACLICRSSRYGLCLFHKLNHLSPLDVVPVDFDTVDEWKYPPYSGHYDGTLSHKCSDTMTDDTFQGRRFGVAAVLTTRVDSSEYCELLPRPDTQHRS